MLTTPRNIRYITGVTVYNVNPDDHVINVDTSVYAVTIVLPNIQDAQLNLYQKEFYINDASNNANNNNITIVGANCIVNGGLNSTVNTNNGSAFATIVGFNSWQVTTDNAFLVGYNTIQNQGISLAQRTILNFVGNAVIATDGGTKTIVTINANKGFFAQTANSTPVTNTLLLGNLLGTGVGTLSVPANAFQVGDSFHLKVSGLMSSRNNDDLTITVRSNGVILATTGFINLPQTTNKVWELEVDFTIRSIGGAGLANINTNGQFIYNKDAALSVEGIGFNSINNTTFDTTITNTLELDAQWAQANPQNSIYSSNCTLFKSY
jgi:hypothetical protein